VKALEYSKKFTPDIDKILNNLWENTPEQGMNYKTYQKLPARR